jgi:MraZ protein
MPNAENNIPNFHGDFVYGIDASRRVMVPARWRPEDKKTVFTALLWPLGANQHILVLPPERWKLMLDKLKAQSLMDSRVAALERRIGAASAELVMDQVGRFCVPEHLAQAAGLGKEAQFVGRLDKFEIWNPERYQASSLADAELAASVAREINL